MTSFIFQTYIFKKYFQKFQLAEEREFFFLLISKILVFIRFLLLRGRELQKKKRATRRSRVNENDGSYSLLVEEEEERERG